jgi:HEAT repeat protein
MVRVLGQHRRDHSGIERALKSVLLSDGGEDALARGKTFDTSVRRKMYELLTAGDTTSKPRMLNAALNDPDAVIRARAIRSIAVDLDFRDRAATLERFLRDDRVPAVRRLALAVLSEHVPERLGAVFPQVLLDRAASVRGLARVVASTQQPALVPRTVYTEALVGTLPGQLAAAIEGVGETGSRADADRVAPFLGGNNPRIRRSALRALAKLDAERAVPAAITALSDDAPSVRTAALHTLSSHASYVNFDLVNRQVSSLLDPTARRNVLRVFLDAPKWDAPAFLLEALRDPDDGVRASAVRLLDRWIESFNRNQAQPSAKQLQRIGALLDSVASRMPEATVRMLRFSIKSS